MAELLGEFPSTVDLKGRFLLPGGLKKQLPAREAKLFVIHRGIEKHLVIYTRKEWSRISEEVNTLNLYLKKNREFIRKFNRGATELELDNTNRLLLPKNLMDYATRQGGSCHSSFCVATGSRPNRRISFYPLKSNIMAMAISSDDFAAYQITRKSGKLSLSPPSEPLWALVPVLALKDSDSLPAGTKPYVSALKNTEQVLFTLGPQGDHLLLALHVTCGDAQAASALLVDFENTTNTLRKWIARERQQPNVADLSGVLVAGSFRRDDRRVYGQWPISRAFVDALAGGSY